MQARHLLFVLCTMLLTACGQNKEQQPDSSPPAEATFPIGQLGDAVQPIAYRLDLTIQPERERFAGITEIDVDIARDTRIIFLHGNGLDVSSVMLTAGGNGDLHPAVYEQLDDTGVARLTFSAPVPAGAATLRLEYTAPFRSRGEGIYNTQIDGESYVFTQFQPIDARRLFPGFDEPVFKTPFDITVTTDEKNVVISNAPVGNEESAGGGLKRVTFIPTEPLPTYLLALAIGQLDVMEGSPLPPNSVRKRALPLRAVATSGKGDRLHFALDNTNTIVTYLEEYFDVEYPYPKLDLISSPEMGGAMENAGAIVYGDALILLADNASVEQLQRFGAVHAHELAHHWFGDLVTPKWWDDTWLNESFASWMGNKAGHAWRPEYQLDTVTLVQALAAMNLDSRIAARQIRQPVTTNLQISNSFDAITYLKGGGVLSMFESYLGEEGFRDGIRAHMRNFPYDVADVEDFMASLAEGSGRPDVVPAFRSFIDQPGVPIVDATLSCDGDLPEISLRQSRYLPVGSKGDSAQTWQLPFCVRYGDGQMVTKECMLLTETDTVMPLQAAACPVFVMPNADGAGYYRFALDTEGWRSLIANFDRLNEKEALVVADSLSAAYQANRLSTTALIEALGIVAASPYPLVAIAPAKDLVRMSNTLASADARDSVLSLIRGFYRPRLDALGAADDSPANTAAVKQAMFRTKLVRLLALDAADSQLRTELAAQARRYLRMDDADATGLDESAVDPALTAVALAAGVKELGAPFVEILIERLLASSDVKFRSEAALALGATEDAALGDRVRQLVLSDKLRAREPTSLAFALAKMPAQNRATFDWFKENEQEFTQDMSHFAYRWLPRMGVSFCTMKERDEVNEFFSSRVKKWQGAERALAEVLEGIELCAALRDVKGPEVDAYFAGG